MRRSVAVVTGGARGIGLAIARALAQSGVTVAIGDLDADLGTAVAGSFGGYGFGVDVRDDASYTRFLADVTAALGPVDLLVNNAGVAVAGAFLDTTAAEHDLQIAVNLGGVERGMRLALPGMVARGTGHVVNIASAAGRIPAPHAAVYSATKHAVLGLTDAVRYELRGSGVFFTTVLPAVVRTEMSAGLRLRGLPSIAPEAVAAAVVRATRRRRPPATMLLPWWLRPIAVLDVVSPQWVRDLARRFASVDVDRSGGVRPYESRVARQLSDRSG